MRSRHAIHLVKFSLSANKTFTQDKQIITDISPDSQIAVVNETSGQGVGFGKEGQAFIPDVMIRRPSTLMVKRLSPPIVGTYNIRTQADDEEYCYYQSYKNPDELVFKAENPTEPPWILEFPVTLERISDTQQDYVYFCARSTHPLLQMFSCKVYNEEMSLLFQSNSDGWRNWRFLDTNTTTAEPSVESELRPWFLEQIQNANESDWVEPLRLNISIPWDGELFYYIWGPDGAFEEASTGDWGIFRMPMPLWRTVYDSPMPQVFDLEIYESVLYACATNGNIYKTSDGETWVLETTLGPSALTMEVYGGKLYVGTVGSGVIYVFDGGSWEIEYDTPEYQIIAFGVYNNELFAGTGNNGKIYKYNGSSWSLTHDASVPHLIRCFAEYEGELYVGCNANTILKYNGSSWSTAVTLDSYAEYINGLIVYNNILYAAVGKGEYGKAYIYTFDGDSWVREATFPDTHVRIFEIYNDVLYAGNDNYGCIYKLVEPSGGSSYWIPAFDIYRGRQILAMKVFKTALFMSSGPYGEIYKKI